MALTNALAGSAERSVVVQAGNAIESYLDGLGATEGVPLSGATGINAKLDRFQTARKVPSKLIACGKYLGNVRNAADHGIDPELGKSWSITPACAVAYVPTACVFISAVENYRLSGTPQM
jgi:hypothetical protein